MRARYGWSQPEVKKESERPGAESGPTLIGIVAPQIKYQLIHNIILISKYLKILR